ncbi:hypothetical protein MCAP1_001405 [Malassezia caprae]|uniref:Uncharacterized protein n=1 Tax=Malassezia caprae TaxID=1381934 RepID=A0AAF0E465_9BASI|nr:hypothetical protein MCAP1_001405 [Malassezia caprae]
MMNYMGKADAFCAYKLTKAPFPLRPQSAPLLPTPKQSQKLRVARPMSHMLHQSSTHTSMYALAASRSPADARRTPYAIQPTVATGALVAAFGLLFYFSSFENPLYAEGLSGKVTPLVAAALWMGHERRSQPESDKVQLMKELAHIGSL